MPSDLYFRPECIFSPSTGGIGNLGRSVPRLVRLVTLLPFYYYLTQHASHTIPKYQFKCGFKYAQGLSGQEKRGSLRVSQDFFCLLFCSLAPTFCPLNALCCTNSSPVSNSQLFCIQPRTCVPVPYTYRLRLALGTTYHCGEEQSRLY